MSPDTPYSVSDGEGRRWPAPDGIPFLRGNRTELAAEALRHLDAGDREGALILLLADQDDWWTGPTAEAEGLRDLVRNLHRLSLRQAMTCLSWGRVADYFAHRWSDPTFLAGLALTEAHWNQPRTVFELACGIGHHLQTLASAGVQTAGSDIVFAKLFIARHFIVPQARLICADAIQPVPSLGTFDLVTCHDAFYFLDPKPEVAATLRQLLHPSMGMLCISHIHNRDWPNLSSGNAMTVAELTNLFPDALLYDDAELTQALAGATAPQPKAGPDLRQVEAFGLADGPALTQPLAVKGRLALPPEGATLRRNPLYATDGVIKWPSDRYEHEYAARVTYPVRSDAPLQAVMGATWQEQARRREMLHLPERW